MTDPAPRPGRSDVRRDFADPGRIFRAIRDADAGIEPAADIAEFLYRNNCRRLLSNIDVPPELEKRIRTDDIVNRIAVGERFASCREVFRRFEERKIPFAVIKGAVLSQAAYGDPFTRRSGDIDILIGKDDAPRVKEILLGCGFVQGKVEDGALREFTRREIIFQSAMTHQLPPFTKKTRNPFCPFVQIDVNTDIFWGESERTCDMNAFLSDTVKCTVCGAETRKLSPVGEFISMCLHHYKDANSLYLLSQRPTPLSHFCDVLYYIRAGHLPLRPLTENAAGLGAASYVHYCLYYTYMIFGDSAVGRYLKAFDRIKGEDLTGYYGLTSAQRRAWTVPLEERMTDRGVSKKFFASLSEREKEKVRTNLKYR